MEKNVIKPLLIRVREDVPKPRNILSEVPLLSIALVASPPSFNLPDRYVSLRPIKTQQYKKPPPKIVSIPIYTHSTRPSAHKRIAVLPFPLRRLKAKPPLFWT